MEVFQALIDACPDAILVCDNHSRLPIQFALSCDMFEHARALINANPVGLTLQESASGDLPLHTAVQMNVDAETFNLILRGYPEACMVKNSDNSIPLECALRRHTFYGFEAIEALVRAFPNSLQMKDSRRGSILFNKICEKYGSGMNEQFIVFVKDECPDVFLVPDGTGFLPLHYAMRALWSVGQAAALAIIRACPEAAKVGAAHGELPLHIVASQADAVVVRALVDAYPGAVVTKCHAGRTPLHYIFPRTTSNPVEAIKALVEARPAVLLLKDDKYGDIPLMTALRLIVNLVSAFGLPTVEWLINAQPESIKVANNELQLPLHIAASRHGARVDVVRALYHAWPDGVNQRDMCGRIPLALAVVRNAPQDVVAFLLEVCPASARMKDDTGMIPLHHAVKRGNVNVTKVLIDAWSDGLKETDTAGNIALFLAFTKEGSFNNAMGKLLLGAWPESVRCTNDDGDLLIHAVSRLCFTSTEDGLSDAFTRAKYLIDAWPESLLQRNREGKLPLHLLLENKVTEEENGSRKRKRDDTANHQLEMVRPFVDNCRESVEVVDEDGNIPLISACENDVVSLDVIDFLTKASLNLLLSNRHQTEPSTGE